MRILNKSDGDGVAGRRSGGIRGGGRHDGLDMLADIAAAVADCKELCGCGHSDPRICYLTVKELKSLFLQTHHSLLLRNPSKPPTKLVIKQNPLPARQPSALVEVSVSRPPPAVKVSFFPPPPAVEVSILPPPPAVIAPVSLPLPQKPFPAVIPPSAVHPAAATRRIQKGFAAPVPNPRHEEEFPPSLKARVSATVGGEEVCSLSSKFTLVIRKKLYSTDLRPNNSRLSIPGRQIESEFLKFLTTEEKTDLEMDRKIELGFFLDPDLQIAGSPTDGCRLGIWKMHTSVVYIVNGGGWRWILQKTEEKMLDMKVGDEMELWSFRTVKSGELCFVFIAADMRRRASAAEKEVVVSGNDQKPEVAVAAMGSVLYNSSSSTLTQKEEEEEEEEEEEPVLDLALRL